MKTIFEKCLLNVGQRIADARHLRAEKEETVAKAIGVTHAVISRIENGRYKSLKLETLIKLCNHLNIPVAEILLE